MAKAVPIDLLQAFTQLKRLERRSQATTEAESRESFAMLSEFDNGGAFVSTFAGNSEWERHAKGDELVFAIEGQTDLILLVNGEEQRNTLKEGCLIIVPKNTWHRFETEGVKILTVTPMPTEHFAGEIPDDH